MTMKERMVFNGDNLRVARLVSGLSAAELADKVSTSRQYISKLESDENNGNPSQDLVEALAYELKVKTDFFSKPIKNQVKEDECHFRKLKSTLVKDRRECVARATIFSKLVSKLEQYLELPEVNIPQFDVESTSDIEKVAISCRKLWGLGDGPICNMVRVVENAGAIVVSFGSVSEKVDALSMCRSRPLILINSLKSSPRIRMDIAHELGHLLFHDGLETGDSLTESQADYFASYFLLPSSALFSEYDRKGKRVNWQSIKDIKIRWGVSTKAIIYRLNQLEIISPSQYRSANIHLSKTRQVRSEWYDEYVSKEAPELIQNALEVIWQSDEQLLGFILGELGITISLLEQIVAIDLSRFQADVCLDKVTFLDSYRA